MIPVGDLIDKMIDSFRNTRFADRFMYISSLIQALFDRGE